MYILTLLFLINLTEEGGEGRRKWRLEKIEISSFKIHSFVGSEEEEEEEKEEEEEEGRKQKEGRKEKNSSKSYYIIPATPSNDGSQKSGEGRDSANRPPRIYVAWPVPGYCRKSKISLRGDQRSIRTINEDP